MKNHYDILGINKNATEDEIKAAYRQAAQLHHPDRNLGDENARERFKEAHEAYEVLSNPAKRAKYDRSTFRFKNKPSSPKDGGFSFGFQNLNSELFSKSSFKGRTISSRLELTFEEAAYGCEKTLKISRRTKCSACKGLGCKEFISCEQCDGLGFFILAYDGPFETRQNCNFCEGRGKIPLKKCEICDGGMYAPKMIDQILNVKIPPNVENGSQLKLAELGEESLRGGTPGDVIITISVKPHDFFVRDGLNLLVDVPVSYSDLVLGAEIKIINLLKETLILKVPAGTQSHSKLKLKNQGLIDLFGESGDILVTVKCETPKSIEEEYKSVIEKLQEMEEKYVTPRRDLWSKKNLNQ